MSINRIGVSIEDYIQVATSLSQVMQGESQESALSVAPIVFMPCDVIWSEELCAPKQWVCFPELDELTAAYTAATSTSV